MDTLQSLGEIGLGSRLKRLSEMLMKEIQTVYKEQQIDFDPYLFPSFYQIAKNQHTTNTALRETLHTSQPAVTQTINKLYKKGLIHITIDDDDKRKKIIKLSKEGKMLQEKMRPLWLVMDKTVKHFTKSTPSISFIDQITKFETALRDKHFINKIRKDL